MRTLAQHVEIWSARRFTLGSVDCAAFVTDWIDSQRGTEYSQLIEREWAGRPHRELLRMLTPGKLREAATEVLGAPVEGGTAQPGDVLLSKNWRGEDALGIAGESLCYAPGFQGVGALPLAGRVQAVWPLNGL